LLIFLFLNLIANKNNATPSAPSTGTSEKSGANSANFSSNTAKMDFNDFKK
jgi:hypothetical protein